METIRNLTRRKLRSSLTISGILIGILALTTMGAMAESVNALLSGGETWFGSSIQVRAAGNGYSLLSLDKANDLLKVPGVEAVTPEITANADPGSNGSFSFGPGPTIITWDPNINRYSAMDLTFASGRAVADGSRGGVVLGQTLANSWHLKVGDGVDLPRRPATPPPGFTQHHFTVSGILNKTQTAPDSFAWVTLPDAQMFLADNLPQALQGRIDIGSLTEGFAVYAAKGTSLAGMDQIAQRISDAVPGVQASKPSQIVSSFKNGGAIFTAITTGAALLALIIGGLSVINTMLMAVSERVREIGLKKAVGARTSHILREFLAESVFIGALGGLIGYGLGVGAATLLNLVLGPSNQLFLITPDLTALALGFAVAIGAVAGVIPAWRAARMDPVAALRAQ